MPPPLFAAGPAWSWQAWPTGHSYAHNPYYFSRHPSANPRLLHVAQKKKKRGCMWCPLIGPSFPSPAASMRIFMSSPCRSRTSPREGPSIGWGAFFFYNFTPSWARPPASGPSHPTGWGRQKKKFLMKIHKQIENIFNYNKKKIIVKVIYIQIKFKNHY